MSRQLELKLKGYCPRYMYLQIIWHSIISNDNNVGAFDVGYCFNALVTDDNNMLEEDITPVERLERFCYVGNDRQICVRYILGKEVDYQLLE